MKVLFGIVRTKSPARGDERIFVRVPENLSEGELFSFVEAIHHGRISEDGDWRTTAAMNIDVNEKIEEIDGERYLRCLNSADVSKLTKNLIRAEKYIRESREARSEVQAETKIGRK